MKPLLIILSIIISATLITGCKQSTDKTADAPLSAADTATVVERTFYPNGDIYEETIFKKSTNTIIIRGYRKGGIIWDETQYVNDELHISKLFDPKGNIWFENIYENSQPKDSHDSAILITKEYNAGGNVIRESRHKGKPRKA